MKDYAQKWLDKKPRPANKEGHPWRKPIYTGGVKHNAKVRREENKRKYGNAI